MSDNDVLALFRCSFDDLHGQSLDPASLVAPDVEPSVSLAGIEFAALPSGLHAVASDIFFFDWHDALAICRFTSRASAEGSNARGRAMETLGVLVRCSGGKDGFALNGQAFMRHEMLRRASEERWDWAQLGAWFEEHKAAAGPNRESAASAVGSLTERFFPLESTPSHPLLALEHLPPALLIPLSKFALSPSSRILFLTRPPLRLGANWSWCVAVLSRAFGRGNGLHALGAVGLGDIGKLERLKEEGKGWVGFTSDAIFKDRPQLYDLLVETYPTSQPTYSTAAVSRPATSPPPPPVLTYSTATSDARRFERTPVNLSWWDAPLDGLLTTGEKGRSWLGSLWDGCGWCLSLLLGQTSGPGAVYLPLADDEGAADTDSQDEEDADDYGHVPDDLQPALNILRTLEQHYAHLSHHLSALVPPSTVGTAGNGPPRVLSSIDLVRLGLSPLALACDRVLVKGLSDGKVVIGDRWI